MADLKEKLLNIQQAIKVTKDINNDFAGFKYRSAEVILEKLKPILLDQKVTVILTDKLEYLGDQYYIKATALLFDLESETEVEVSAYAREEKSRPKMSEPQLTGSASSYARKYALSGLLLLDDNKDPDSHEAPRAPKVDLELAKLKGELQAQFSAHGINSLEDIKGYISGVIQKETIDNVVQAKLVLRALQDKADAEAIE